MGDSTHTGDWEAAGLAGFGFAMLVGADASCWMFRSRSAAVGEPFVSLTAAGGCSFGPGQFSALDTAMQQLRGTARTGNAVDLSNWGHSGESRNPGFTRFSGPRLSPG